MKACVRASEVNVSSEGPPSLRERGAESPVPQAGSCGEPIGVQFAWSGVLVGELLQSLFSRGSSSSGCCPGHPKLQASQSRAVLGEGAGYPTGGLGAAGQLEDHSPALPPLPLRASPGL